jgi:hypothetical protein
LCLSAIGPFRGCTFVPAVDISGALCIALFFSPHTSGASYQSMAHVPLMNRFHGLGTVSRLPRLPHLFTSSVSLVKFPWSSPFLFCLIIFYLLTSSLTRITGVSHRHRARNPTMKSDHLGVGPNHLSLSLSLIYILFILYIFYIYLVLFYISYIIYTFIYILYKIWW